MGQLYWPETTGLSRYSIPSHDDHYRASISPASKALLQQTYQNSLNDPSNPQTSKLFHIDEDNKSFSSNELEKFYDGLISLNETRLDELIETDLISTSNG